MAEEQENQAKGTAMTAPPPAQPVAVAPQQGQIPPEVVNLIGKALGLGDKVQETKLQIATIKSKSADKFLNVSQAENKDERHHESRRHLRHLVFAVIVLVLAFAFSVYAIEKGMTQLVGDLLKVVIGAVLGGFGGWGLRGRHERRTLIEASVPDDDDDEDDE